MAIYVGDDVKGAKEESPCMLCDTGTRWRFRGAGEYKPVCASCLFEETAWGVQQRDQVQALAALARENAKQRGREFKALGPDGKLTREAAESLLRGAVVLSRMMAARVMKARA
jgi:hypothetical protein